jgi:hypothetical protein
LLIKVATELAVFLLGDGAARVTGGSFDELRESQEKGLLNFLLVVAGAEAGAGAGAWGAAAVAAGLLAGDSFAEGDHGMGGRAFVMLPKERVLEGFSGGGRFSKIESIFCCMTWVGNGPTCLAAR